MRSSNEGVLHILMLALLLTHALLAQDHLKKTALGELLESNNKELPVTLSELRKTLDKRYGSVTTVIVPFSGAPAYTSLEEPRNIYMSPVGDLYIGAIERIDGTVEFEFISRNKDTDEFDFGIIQKFGTERAEIKFVDKTNCMLCHKSGGPIFWEVPWGNTTARMRSDSPPSAEIQLKQISDGTMRSNLDGISLHHSLLEKLSGRDFSLKEIYETAKEHDESRKKVQEPKNKEMRIPIKNFFHYERKYQWRGADLMANGARVENIIFLGNEILELHREIKSASLSQKKMLIPFLLSAAICRTTFEYNDPQVRLLKYYFSEKASKGLMHPILLKVGKFSHFTENGFTNEHTHEQIKAIHNKKVISKMRNTIPEDSPLRSENFKEGGYAFGNSSYENRSSDFSSHFVGSYGISLELPEEDLSAFCKSKEFQSLLKLEILPNKEKVHQAIKAFREGSSLKSIEESVMEEPKPKQVKACMECHNGQISGIEAPFDIGDLEVWRTKLKSTDPNTKETIKYWKNKTVKYLAERQMPPQPFFIHLTETEIAILVEYLKTGD